MPKLLSPFILLTLLLSGCNGKKSSAIEPIDPDTSGAPEIVWDTAQDHLRTGRKKIDFYNINDTHGAIVENGEEPGIAKISTYLKGAKESNPDGYVFTSTGDMWQGSADSNITRGALMCEWLNYEECSAMSLGNHEFDWSIEAINANRAIAKYEFLACNIVNKEDKKPVGWVKPYTTITRNGVHIGIIGAIGEGITGSILANNVKGLSFEKPDAYVMKWSKYLKDNGADVILFLYHYSPDDTSYDLGNYVDAAFGGHDHRVIKKTLANSVPMLEGASNGRYISHINMSYDFDKNIRLYGQSTNSQIYPTYYEDNPEVNEIKARFADEIDIVKNEQVAYLDAYMDAYNDIPLMYDQYANRYYKEVIKGIKNIKFVVSNNARSGLNAGLVTYGDIYKSLPFDNCLTLCAAKGEDILNTATGIVAYESSRWYFPEAGETLVDRYNANNYLNNDEYYFFLAIDYVSTYENYEEWINIVETYGQEDALPRNIVKRYMANEYPLP